MGAEVNERVAGRSREKSESVLLSEEKICRAVALVWRAQHCGFPWWSPRDIARRATCAGPQKCAACLTHYGLPSRGVPPAGFGA